MIKQNIKTMTQDPNIKNIIIGAFILLIISLGIYFAYGYFNNKSNIKKPEITNPNLNIDTNKKEFKIVAFGDSLTAGLGVELKDSYPSILENILNNNSEYQDYNVNFKVINMGVSGETTSGGLDRVDFVLEQKPDLILLGLGANDMLRSTDPLLVAANLNSILQRLSSAKVPVILLGMQSAASNGRDYKKSFDAVYTSLSQKYNISLVPFFLEGVALVPSLNNSDGIHPNRSGYEKIINENILPVLNLSLNNTIKN